MIRLSNTEYALTTDRDPDKSTITAPSGTHRGFHFVSSSQVSSFDAKRLPKHGCERKWALKSLFGVKAPEHESATRGKEYHVQVKNWYEGGTINSPALIAGMKYWPRPGPHILTEHWFTLDIPGWPDTRPQRKKEDGYPIGFGRYTGRIDILDEALIHAAHVTDIKTTGDIKTASKPIALLTDPQMVSYGFYALSRLPQADEVCYRHVVHQVHPDKKPDAKNVMAGATRADNQAAWEQILITIGDMRKAADEKKHWREFTPNWAACWAYGGCPYRDLCTSTESQQKDLVAAREFAAELIHDYEREQGVKTMNPIKPETTAMFKTASQSGFPSVSAIIEFMNLFREAGHSITTLAEGAKISLDEANKLYQIARMEYERAVDNLKNNMAAKERPNEASRAYFRAAYTWVQVCAQTPGIDKPFLVDPQLPALLVWLRDVKAAEDAAAAAPKTVAAPASSAAPAKPPAQADEVIKARESKANVGATGPENARALDQAQEPGEFDEQRHAPYDECVRMAILDKPAISKGAAILCNWAGKILRLCEVLEPFLRQAAESAKVQHYGLTDYGHGRSLAVSLCLAHLKADHMGDYIVLIDTRDPVQFQILQEMYGYFDIVL